jgi:hypothetical protein
MTAGPLGVPGIPCCGTTGGAGGIGDGFDAVPCCVPFGPRKAFRKLCESIAS